MPTTATHLSTVDLAIVALYLVGITLFGLSFRKRNGGAPADKSLKSYFLADNTIPWWAIALSIVSAETSTLTIISIPGVAFVGDFGFLQVVMGYMLGRIVVAALFLPRYFAGDMLTAYQLIDQRFGSMLHKVTAGLFLLTRAAAEGVRVFAVSIVVGIAIGTGDTLSIGIISLLTLLYTFEGGMAAVVWTDVVQMAIYVGGTFVAIFTLGNHVPGGWGTIRSIASDAGKYHLFNFAFNLTTTYTFWAGVLGGAFLTMASHGTDQLMVQRLLASRNLKESRLALLSSGVVIFIQFALFLLIGMGLFVFYGLGNQGNGIPYVPAGITPDRLFPNFIVHEMPVGIAGLLIAAILAAAMSNLSAALNSLSSTTVVDFYMRLRPRADDRERALISKSSTIFWALVLFGIAVATVHVGGKGHVVEIALSIASVAYGCLLGVFLLGTLTKFATEIGTAIGMICGFLLNLWLWQASFPKHLAGITIPHIAFTWYVLIGAFVTFAIGALASLIFRKQSPRTLSTLTAAALSFAVILYAVKAPRIVAAQTQAAQPAPDFSQVTQLMNDAIAAHKLPGAVVLIGHNHRVVFEHAYGNRKLSGEPGPAPLPDNTPNLTAEPMTEDTIFDMASLTKCLATATAIMQLYEAGKITSFDDPVEKYLPAFNPTHDETRAKVTLRNLLTHTSGEAPDVNLKDGWGLVSPDHEEGIRRALTTPLHAAPGPSFVYSDINFILLGAVIEKLTGQPEDTYVQQHIFEPLDMADTRYLPLHKVCGPHKQVGAAIGWAPKPPGRVLITCPAGMWSSSLLERIAPTAHDNEGAADNNPDFDRLLRGTVHDPTTRRMGGIAGHAGVFSTAHDVSLYASALLEKLLHNTGPFPLKQSTLQLMTVPEEPGHTSADLSAANAANQVSIAAGDKPAEPGLAPHYPAVKEHNLRGFGWDIDTAFSKPRGAIFPIGSFGHTGFTGTSLWMDPASDTYVILLANAIHPRGNTPISNLRGQVATAAARALNLTTGGPSFAPSAKGGVSSEARLLSFKAQSKQFDRLSFCCGLFTPTPVSGAGADSESDPASTVLTGIDILESTHFTALHELRNFGLLTNQSGLDRNGQRTVDILFKQSAEPAAKLTTLFTPEHGLSGKQDTEHLATETDPATNLPVISLYGTGAASRHPRHEQLQNLDAVIIDLQDAGVHFWTYEAAMGYFLEAAAIERRDFQHDLEIIVLDRPNPVGGLAVQGPVSDPGRESYVNYMPLPIRHGLTMGELAQYINGETTLPPAAPPAPATQSYHATHTPPMIVGSDGIARHPDGSPAHGLGVHLTVVPMQNWQRSMLWPDTGLPWTTPSPNLRSPEAALRYPALGFIETTNLSVGRGSVSPFAWFGAGYAPAKSTGKNTVTPSVSRPATGVITGGNGSVVTGAVNPQNPPPANAASQGNNLSASLTFSKDSHTAPAISWFNGERVADALNARHLPGASFAATKVPIAEDANHYPFHGQTIEAVKLTLTDPRIADTPEIGLEILAVLHNLYPAQFNLDRAMVNICSEATIQAIERGDDPHAIAAAWAAPLAHFRNATAPYLLYK